MISSELLGIKGESAIKIRLKKCTHIYSMASTLLEPGKKTKTVLFKILKIYGTVLLCFVDNSRWQKFRQR